MKDIGVAGLRIDCLRLEIGATLLTDCVPKDVLRVMEEGDALKAGLEYGCC
jgi:hypothetical protein